MKLAPEKRNLDLYILSVKYNVYIYYIKVKSINIMFIVILYVAINISALMKT